MSVWRRGVHCEQARTEGEGAAVDGLGHSDWGGARVRSFEEEENGSATHYCHLEDGEPVGRQVDCCHSCAVRDGVKGKLQLAVFCAEVCRQPALMIWGEGAVLGRGEVGVGLELVEVDRLRWLLVRRPCPAL